MPPLILRAAFVIGVVGFAVSAAVHAATFTNAAIPGWTWVLHVGIFVAFVPVVLGLQPWLEPEGLSPFDIKSRLAVFGRVVRGIPRVPLAGFVVLSVYVTVAFAVGMGRLIEDPATEGPSTRLFSGHWMVFYAGSALLAHRLLALADAAGDSGERPPGPRGQA